MVDFQNFMFGLESKKKKKIPHLSFLQADVSLAFRMGTSIMINIKQFS